MAGTVVDFQRLEQNITGPVRVAEAFVPQLDFSATKNPSKQS
jgi:hypothetical protein